jgi:predicted amidophosphoribosyltransferase
MSLSPKHIENMLKSMPQSGVGITGTMCEKCGEFMEGYKGLCAECQLPLTDEQIKKYEEYLADSNDICISEGLS